MYLGWFVFKLGALPGQVFLPLPGEQPAEAKAGGGFTTGRAWAPHPKGRAVQAGPRRGASRSLEGRQPCAAWSCSGAARGLVWVCLQSLLSCSLSYSLPFPWKSAMLATVSPAVSYSASPPRTQLQAAPRGPTNLNTGSAFTSPSLSCFSLWPLRCLEEGLGSDAHLPT